MKYKNAQAKTANSYFYPGFFGKKQGNRQNKSNIQRR
jgi:hypothetical protein